MELLEEIENLERDVQHLRDDYDLVHLEALKRTFARLSSKAGLLGYDEASKLCQIHEIDVISKIKNFNVAQPPVNWFKEIGIFVGKLKATFSPSEEVKDDQPLTLFLKELEGLISHFKETKKRSVAKPEEVQKPVQQGNKRVVVIIDDDEDILNLLSHEFREVGYDVKTFMTGSAATTFLTNPKNLGDIGLLIVDRILPDTDGLEILRKVKGHPAEKIPALLLSVLSPEGESIGGLQQGAIDYIMKPFSSGKVLEKAMTLMNLS